MKRVRKKILLNVAASLVISFVFVAIIIAIIRGIDEDVAQIQFFDTMRSKTHALTVLSATLPCGPNASCVRQIKETHHSLRNLLREVTDIDAGEEPLVRQIEKNLIDVGQILEKLIAGTFIPESTDSVDRYNILSSQLWMETQFISDDAQRLIDMNHTRILNAEKRAGILAIILIVTLILINATISFFSGRHLLRMQDDLRNALDRAEEGDQMLSALMAQVPEIIVMTDEKLTLTRISRQAEELFGLKAEGKSVAEAAAKWRMYHGDGKSPLAVDDLPLVRAVRTGKVIRDAEFVQITPHGERLPLLCTAAPILDDNGHVIGGILACRDIWELKKVQQSLEESVSQRTAQLQLRNRELQELTRQTISVMENDRKALAKEIHDGIGGSMSAIKMLLESRLTQSDIPPPEGMMSLERIIGYLADTIKESKRIAYQMRSLALDEFGLTAAVSENIKKFKEFFPSIEVDFKISVSQDDLHDETKTIVYRVVQEALNNIGKYSGADKVEIVLSMNRDRLLLRVQDNGCGFDVQQALNREQLLTGFGLRSMKERIEICKGIFEVTSIPGKGTVLTASIPTGESALLQTGG